MRTLFNQTMAYINANYAGVQVNFNPSFAANDLGQATDGSSNYGCATGFNHASHVTISGAATGTNNLAACVTTALTSSAVPMGWLQISGTAYSAFGYLAKKYSSSPYPSTFINRFSPLHEPTTNNNNPYYSSVFVGGAGGSASTPGSGADWKNFLAATLNEIQSNNANAKLCVAFDRFESSWQTPVISSSPAPTCIGYDSYTTDLSNTSTGLGAIDGMINTAKAHPYEVYISESGPTAWVNYGTASTDANSWWGSGNCNWLGTDLFRQDYVLTSLYFSYKGVTELNFFTILNPAIFCIVGSPSLTGQDRVTNLTYANNVASASITGPPTNTNALGSAHQTPFFQQFYALYEWPFGQVSSAPISSGEGTPPI